MGIQRSESAAALPETSATSSRHPKIVLTWYPSASGGAEQSIVDLSGHLVAAGIETRLIWWGNFLPPGADSATSLVQVAGLGDYREAIRSELKGSPRQTVVISSHRTFLIDSELARFAGSRVIAVLRALLVPGHALRIADSDTGELRSAMFDALDLTPPGLHAWIGVSQASRLSLQAVGVPEAKTFAVYNGVRIPERWRPSPPESRQAAPRIVVMARATEWKELPLAVLGFASFLACRPDATLTILTDGPEAARLRALVTTLNLTPSVRLPGWQSEISDWLSAADILVHTATLEGFGRAVAEAAAHGRVCVVPNTPAMREIVVPGETGFVFQPHDPQDLARALRAAIDLVGASFAALEVAARARAQSLFSLEAMARRYTAIATQAAAS